jgi:hypothetical protein
MQRDTPGYRIGGQHPGSATILAPSMAFMDSTVVKVALPAIQARLQAGGLE